jgi:hypothetical protein
MRRVCFIGNSHLAAVRLALDAARARGALGDVAADTFAAIREGIAGCAIRDGCLVPAEEAVAQSFRWTSGGQDRVELGRYDDIFVVAGRSPFEIGCYLPKGPPPPPSPAVYRAVAAALLDDWGPDLARRIARAAPAARVHFVGEPEISDASPFARELLAMTEGEAPQREAGTAGLLGIRRAIAAAVAAVPHGLASVPGLPPGVLGECGAFTRHAFCRGSVHLREGLDQPHPETEFRHMNAAYGDQLLRHLGLVAAGEAASQAA